MHDENKLKRFIDAQETIYPIALSEVINGKKQSHWMWFIFPQIAGLGLSETSRYYSIKGIHEAATFLRHPVLGSRLVNICKELIKLGTNNASIIFGRPDDMKLKSSMTLFSSVEFADPVFKAVLEKFFNGIKDDNTLLIIEK